MADSTVPTWVGIEIANTAMIAAVIAGDDGSVADKTWPVAGEALVTDLSAFINTLKAEFGDIAGVGIAVPGLVDRATDRVAFSAHIPGHSDIDFVNELGQATGARILIENDANAAAFGEFRLGAGRGCRHMLYVTLGMGVGGAFIFNGEIWRGAAGFAGEFGYVPINSEGMRLEDVASSANIIRRTRSRFHQDNTSSLNRLGEEEITLDAIIAAAKNEDDFAQMMLERTGVYVGAAVASVINLLNIEKIVIGGEIMAAEHLVLDAIKDRARELAFDPAFRSTSIVEGELGRQAAAVGVAIMARDAG